MGTDLQRHACMHARAHAHPQTLESQLSLYQSPNVAGKEGNLLVIEALGSGLKSPISREICLFHT